MPQLVGDDVVLLAKEIEKGRHFLAQSRKYLYVVFYFLFIFDVVVSSHLTHYSTTAAAVALLLELHFVQNHVSPLKILQYHQ